MKAPQPLQDLDLLRLFTENEEIPNTGLRLHHQQDPHEFITTVLAHMLPQELHVGILALIVFLICFQFYSQ